MIDSFAILIVFGSLETSMLIITASIPALRPLFQQKQDSASYLKRLTSSPSRKVPSDHHTSHIKATHAYTYPSEPDRHSVSTVCSTSTPNQHQTVHDDNIQLVPFTKDSIV